jgi:hypothetical protein
MGMRIRFPSEPDQSLAWSYEQLATGLFLDFKDNTFKATPGTPTRPLVEGTGLYRGSYRDNLADDVTKAYPDGDYSVYVHEVAGHEQRVVLDGILLVTMTGGDDRFAMPQMNATLTFNKS